MSRLLPNFSYGVGIGIWFWMVSKQSHHEQKHSKARQIIEQDNGIPTRSAFLVWSTAAKQQILSKQSGLHKSRYISNQSGLIYVMTLFYEIKALVYFV
jgi:hypothetical protein